LADGIRGQVFYRERHCGALMRLSGCVVEKNERLQTDGLVAGLDAAKNTAAQLDPGGVVHYLQLGQPVSFSEWDNNSTCGTIGWNSYWSYASLVARALRAPLTSGQPAKLLRSLL